MKYLSSINGQNFEDIALELFRYQYARNDIYRRFTDALHIIPGNVHHITGIPFLPVSFYKTHKVVIGDINDDTLVFSSSTTTSDIPGRHYVQDKTLYDESLFTGFAQQYGDVKDYAILALLPSYLQRGGASLVYMAERLMQASGHRLNGFYLDEYEKLAAVLAELEAGGQPTLLLGVTFALLDFAEAHPMQLKHTIVMETGGMKGRRREMTRGEVHDVLKEKLGVKQVHSEYGMTELLSQAYATHDGLFRPSATMRVLVRDMNDPLDVSTSGSGCINVIDLANVHSCAFIATDDMGRIYADGSFEVLGRADHSALRGCNLMVV
ncbi:MAG: acyl transferase [Chitinophagales bacterium]|nr:acyl transferase [Chitinophagales bacterium]